MSIEARLEAGHVLSILQRRHKDEAEWCDIQEKNGLSRTTVWEFIAAYKRSTAMGHNKEEVAANHDNWTEVLVTYGVVKERPRKVIYAPVQAERVDEAGVVGTAAPEDTAKKSVAEAETASNSPLLRPSSKMVARRKPTAKRPPRSMDRPPASLPIKLSLPVRSLLSRPTAKSKQGPPKLAHLVTADVGPRLPRQQRRKRSRRKTRPP